MDQLIAFFADFIKFAFAPIYNIFSGLVDSAAKGNAFACLLLAGIAAPFALAFLRLTARRGDVGGAESMYNRGRWRHVW